MAGSSVRARWEPVIVAFALQFATPVAAHTGTTHAGTPHGLLLVLVAVGVLAVGASATLVRRGRLTVGWGLGGVLSGALVGGFGAIGLVEIQIVASIGPELEQLFPLLNVLAGSAVLFGSLLVGRLRWPDRPRYAALGIVLGAWILYPSVFPNEGVTNPVGYLVVLALPTTVGYILSVDASWAVTRVRTDRRLAVVWATTTLLVGVFLAFSAGTLSLHPDWGPTPPTDPFVTAIPVADPLVYWPAVEFVVPSVPLAGMVSAGTLLLFGTVAGVVGLNAATIVDRWAAGTAGGSGLTLGGLTATTGATACCCCAPALYGVLSALLGASATPLYWAFLDSSSPVGALFLAGSIALLIGGLLRHGPPVSGSSTGVA